MRGGWGRRAAGRLGNADKTRAMEDDALLKELNKQLNYTVDYDLWKRETEQKQKAVLGQNKNLRVPRKIPPRVEKPPTEKTFFTVASAPSFLRRAKLEPEVECNHHHGRVVTPEVDTEQVMTEDRIKILKLKIHARKYTIDEYKQRYEKLLARNMELRKLMEQNDSFVADDVKGLLRRYEKFRGGISTLNAQLRKEVSATKKDLMETERNVQFDLLAIESKVDQVNKKLESVKHELYVLQNYKDKEYPVKSIKISELQKEIDHLKVSNLDDHEELDNIITSELAKYKKQQEDVKDDITKKVTELMLSESGMMNELIHAREYKTAKEYQEAISKMHPTLKDMALQNMVMRKEKEFHLKQIQEVEENNRALENTITDLLKDPKTNAKLQLFPEFFPTQEKCTPDMEVVLDIPTQEWLPI